MSESAGGLASFVTGSCSGGDKVLFERVDAAELGVLGEAWVGLGLFGGVIGSSTLFLPGDCLLPSGDFSLLLLDMSAPFRQFSSLSLSSFSSSLYGTSFTFCSDLSVLEDGGNEDVGV